jgi:hypothetical protein
MESKNCELHENAEFQNKTNNVNRYESREANQTQSPPRRGRLHAKLNLHMNQIAVCCCPPQIIDA